MFTKLQVAAFVLLVSFYVRATSTNQLRPWSDYRTIMWVSDSAYKQRDKVPLFFDRLREMGINTAMVHGSGDSRPLLENNFPYYVENLVTRGLCLKFQSTVTDWDKFVTDWNKSGRPESAFVRDYSFDDPQWIAASKKQMEASVRRNMTNAPLAYDIRDELSVTVSANPFDYDFSPTALAGFRAWLKTQYSSLDALNSGWETSFASWDDVKPFSTDLVKNRMSTGHALPKGKPDWQALARQSFELEKARQRPTAWNLAPWCDFRTYMDLSLANTLGALRDVARKLDPHTPVGIEGTQMPSAWGGYDLWRLSQVLDWVEPYDIGNARDIFGSFMPGMPMVTTVFENDTNKARRRLWHLLLEGDRGCIVWWSEDIIDWKDPEYKLTPKGRALAPVFKEMTSPLAGLFLRAERESDPVFLVYSQPSIQVNWLLESMRDGSSWYRRFSSYESSHNVMAQKRNGWLKLFQDLGYTPRFVAAEQLAKLNSPGSAVLVMSETRALSDAQAMAAVQFLNQETGRVALTDAPTGVFNEHGRLRHQATPVEELSASTGVCVTRASRAGGNQTLKIAADTERDIAVFAKDRKSDRVSDWYAWAEQFVSVPREVVVPAETHTRVHRYRLGKARLFAFERNIDYQMSESLKQAGGNEALEKPVGVNARLATKLHLYNLRTGKYLGHTDQLNFTLEPWQPSLFAGLTEKVDGDILGHLQRR